MKIRQDGTKIIPTKWKEVRQAYLGTLKKPNKKIIEIRLEPIIYEEDSKPKNMFEDLFK